MELLAELTKSGIKCLICKIIQFVIIDKRTCTYEFLGTSIELVGSESTIITPYMEVPNLLKRGDGSDIHAKPSIKSKLAYRSAK